MTTMPFGKYENHPLEEIPDYYLEWLAAQPWLRDTLRLAIESEISSRNSAPRQQYAADVDYSVAKKIIDSGFRSLAKQYHPDVNGDHEDMVRLNRTAEWLRMQITSVSS